MKRILLTGTLVAMLAACTQQAPPQSVGSDKPLRDKLFGVGPINYKWTKNEENVRYNFDTNLNPQVIRNLSEQKLSISDDQDKIRQLVTAESPFEPGMVAIVGNRAYVHIRSQDGEVTQADIDSLQDKLGRAMPRYTIRLLIQD